MRQGYRTMVSSKWSRDLAGSAVRPEWTGEGWMMVLRSEVSQ